jgi:hypothetical protein
VRDFILCIILQINYYGDHIKEDELSGTCGIHGRNEKYMGSVSPKIGREKRNLSVDEKN